MNNGIRLLTVDDEKDMTRMIEKHFDSKGYIVSVANNGKEALEVMKGTEFDVVLLDLRMPGIHGEDVLEVIKRDHPEVCVIIVTQKDKIKDVVRTVRLGAYDHIVKPFSCVDLEKVVEKGLEYQRILNESKKTKGILKIYESEVNKKYHSGTMIGNSNKMKQVDELIEQCASTDITVLITGESGTGKELAANAIHNKSPRSDAPFIKINCAAIPNTLLESELFGVIPNHPGFDNKEGLTGKIELAEGGTFLLDEIGDMHKELQKKILRVVDDKIVYRIGDNKGKEVDVRIICATNKDLESEIQKGTFRLDLYQRINVFLIALPPLRKHKEDINLLIDHFLETSAKKLKKDASGISPEARKILQTYDYPGNIRELKNIITRAIMITKGKTIPLEAVHVSPTQVEEAKMEHELMPFSKAKEDFEKEYFQKALTQEEGNISKAAERAAMDRKNFREKMKKYDINQPNS